MKIAVVGKGGSGKSTVSWALVNYLTKIKNKKVLAVDADHNMDLTSCLGYQITDNTKLFYHSDQDFRAVTGMPPSGRFAQYLELKPHSFSYNPSDDFLHKYLNKINDNLDLLEMGLGDESIMYGDKCSHGLSAPLKYMLPTLTPKNDSWVVIDSVAGADMVNFGLYFGCDMVLCVVEPSSNSIKVAKQLKQLCAEQYIPLAFVLNKFDKDNAAIFEESLITDVVGHMLFDLAIMKYDFENLSESSLQHLHNLVETLTHVPLSPRDQLNGLKAFEAKKALRIAA